MANKVTIIPNTSKVKVSQEETTIVTIQTPGPKGDTGRTAYSPTTDLETRNITSSGTISSSGDFIGNIQTTSINASSDFTLTAQPNKIILSGSTDVNGLMFISGTIESEGLILTSPNGTRFKLTVENGGGLAAEEL